MFEADSQNFASAPSVPRGFRLQNARPPFGGDHRGTLGRGGVPSAPPPPPVIHPCPNLSPQRIRNSWAAHVLSWTPTRAALGVLCTKRSRSHAMDGRRWTAPELPSSHPPTTTAHVESRQVFPTAHAAPFFRTLPPGVSVRGLGTPILSEPLGPVWAVVRHVGREYVRVAVRGTMAERDVPLTHGECSAVLTYSLTHGRGLGPN